MPSKRALELAADIAPCPSLRVRRWRYSHPRQQPTPPAAHPDVEISWVAAGQVAYRIGRQDIALGGERVIVIPENVEHACRFYGPRTEGCSIKLSSRLLARVAGSVDTGSDRLSPGLAPLRGAASQLARMIFAEALQPSVGQAVMLEALAEALAVELLRQATGAVQTVVRLDPRILAAKRAIELRYGDPLSVDELAREAGMSRYHFCRRFRSVTGKSPYGYLIETRLVRAAALLRRGDHNVTEAAMAVGFSELGRFSRRFRELIGMSPAAYRRAQQPLQAS